jgi:hypothetical protein
LDKGDISKTAVREKWKDPGKSAHNVVAVLAL